MPDEPRRIIIEKSSTVRRRYQRSNKRFKFTASQLRRIEREEELDRRAKNIREKEQKRIANKRKREEKEAKDREERKRLGLPDPNAPKVPSSQPLLAAFLGNAKPKKPVECRPVSPVSVDITTETEARTDGGDTEVDSAGGDTEVDSDVFDDLDEEIEEDISCLQEDNSCLQDAGILHYSCAQPPVPETSRDTLESMNDDDDDEFSDCSAFDDEDIMNTMDAAAAIHLPSVKSKNKFPMSHSQTLTPSTSVRAPTSTLLQPHASDQKHSKANPITSFNDSFRDETADFLEEIFSRGCGDSFGELLQLDSQT
ncbi:hypothetical protein N7462_000865 [Penicillium macrosclerotiorum]|uniref:uncharacterized protein n=1 Tax=Penicillium macrosclerotiorum TaxID=303699 RepID=UPI002547B980|nr:uncharacterized protein N7462_000865 [Penicillium macrosclerotiorum]KAJ5698860.1 hypothetical protein N7462_000865 [Penicillium macrosclerotiorum]